jgi:hypothetical protein
VSLAVGAGDHAESASLGVPALPASTVSGSAAEGEAAWIRRGSGSSSGSAPGHLQPVPEGMPDGVEEAAPEPSDDFASEDELALAELAGQASDCGQGRESFPRSYGAASLPPSQGAGPAPS